MCKAFNLKKLECGSCFCFLIISRDAASRAWKNCRCQWSRISNLGTTNKHFLSDVVCWEKLKIEV